MIVKNHSLLSSSSLVFFILRTTSLLLTQTHQVVVQAIPRSYHTSYIQQLKQLEEEEEKQQNDNESSFVQTNTDIKADNKYADVNEFYFEQKLDHFLAATQKSSAGSEVEVEEESIEEKTFQQRYFHSSRFVTSNKSPIATTETETYAFLCVGGEGPALTKNVLVESVHCSGDMIEAAKYLIHKNKKKKDTEDENASASVVDVHLFALEHRYFGKSYPDNNFILPSTFNENLKYLSSKQALKDLEYFVQQKNEEFGWNQHNVKWITFGGSYPGMLSAWARLQFPSLIYGSISSSSPVEAKTDFHEYYEHVAFMLQYDKIGGSPECLQVIQEGHSTIQEYLKENNYEKIAQMFQICDGAQAFSTNERNGATWVGDGVVTLPFQDNDPSCTTENCNIEKICNTLLSSEQEEVTPMERLANLAKSQLQGQTCRDIDWNSYVQFMKSPILSKPNGMRSWTYMTCTEFGYYQTCKEQSDCPFGRGMKQVEQDLELCEVAFGIPKDQVPKNIDQTNDFYGGWDLKGVNRIFFVNGDADPWSTLSVTSEHGNQDLGNIMTQGASHHFWTHKVKDTDSKEVVDARKTIYKVLEDWLVEEDEDNDNARDNKTAENSFTPVVMES